MKRNSKKYHNGFNDKLKPRLAVDVTKARDFDQLLEQMSQTAFGGRHFGRAVDTLVRMASDPNCFTVMTLSGAMTPAGMGLLICEMIERGFVQAVVSTGALMTHGFVEASGRSHFQHDPKMSDAELYDKGYNRIYDVIELEQNLDDVELIVDEVLNKIESDTILSSNLITERLGAWLSKNTNGRGILKSAYKHKVPVYIPALTDSELGLDIALYNRRRVKEGEAPLLFDPFLDVEHYTELIARQKTLGIFTIGGGVPRNWAQQVAPYIELIARRSPESRFDAKQFKYGLRICPEPARWGGLSGCTYSEGVSWGKFLPEEQGGIHTEVLEDATIAWPIILKAAIQRLEKNGLKKIKKDFSSTPTPTRARSAISIPRSFPSSD
ncbi:MAG TPA: deoxyhypusine synthase family protein [Candidatus Paceibacterota bacterium]|nr:deoxyhypusine synthase family protein [Candidatus Paceibacterota bacterium]